MTTCKLILNFKIVIYFLLRFQTVFLNKQVVFYKVFCEKMKLVVMETCGTLLCYKKLCKLGKSRVLGIEYSKPRLVSELILHHVQTLHSELRQTF